MGVPGSGKSTFAKTQQKAIVINQDTLGSRETCIEMFHIAVADGKYDIIIDRCNINKSQRKVWIDLAKTAEIEEIELVWFQTDTEECIKRIHERVGHKTITEKMPLDKKKEIVYSFIKSLEFPELDEGITSITLTK